MLKNGYIVREITQAVYYPSSYILTSDALSSLPFYILFITGKLQKFSFFKDVLREREREREREGEREIKIYDKRLRQRYDKKETEIV